MSEKKEPKYIHCPPTPQALELMQRALMERREQVIEGLVAVMWENHQDEITDGHGGDRSCSICDMMREACEVIKMAPDEATHLTVPQGAVYTEDDS